MHPLMTPRCLAVLRLMAEADGAGRLEDADVLLRRLTWDYLSGKSPAECYGVGQYGRDALALFVDGRKDLKAVADHWLDGYLHMRRWQGVPPPRWDKAGHSR